MSFDRFTNELQLASISAQNSGNVTCFDKLLSIDVTKGETVNRIAQLQPVLQGMTDDQIKQKVESMNLFDGDWGAFTIMVCSYLRLCRDFDPTSILRSHDLFLIYYNDLTVSLMNNQFGNSMAHLLRESTGLLMPLMKRLDVVLNIHVKGKHFKRLIFISTNLTKIFNHLRALKVMSEKKKLIIFVVNNLNTIYFTINNPLLCANIFANMNLANLKLTLFAKSEQVEYRYILGRYYLIKNQLFKAYHHLDWCFKNCHSQEFNNCIKILRYLIPVSLLIGKYPSKNFIQQIPELRQIYTPLIRHLKTGNFFEFQKHLQQNEQYFKSKKLLILLAQKSRILIFKNLFLNTFQLVNSQRQNFRLLYNELQVALIKSIRSSTEQTNYFRDQYLYQVINESIDYSFIENVVVSLIENDLLKGNNHAGLKTVILSRKDPFPDVFKSYQSKYGVNSDESWMN